MRVYSNKEGDGQVRIRLRVRTLGNIYTLDRVRVRVHCITQVMARVTSRVYSNQ